MIYPDLSNAAQGKPQPLTRKEFRRMMNAVARANAPGKDDRIAAAQAKRDRKNERRAIDSALSNIGQMKAREALEMGIQRGLWHVPGIFSEIVFS